MESGSISKRYARALLDLARESDISDSVLKELTSFEKLLQESVQLHSVMTNPSFTADERVAVLKDLFGTVKVSDLTRRFVLYVAKKRRMGIFTDILKECQKLSDQLNGIVRVTVTSAVPISGDTEKNLVDQIQEMVGRTVIISKTIDPLVLGGLVTRVDGLVIDGSIATQLTRMKTALLGEQLN